VKKWSVKTSWLDNSERENLRAGGRLEETSEGVKFLFVVRPLFSEEPTFLSV
jgi:hypothetical protein